MAAMPLNSGATIESFPTLPAEVYAILHRFLLDRKTGNVKLNIKEGRVLGYQVEEIVSLKG